MERLKRIKISDILDIFKFVIILPIAIIYRLILKIQNKKIWLISEDPNEAGDNGYWLFRYIRINHPNRDVFYAINKNSPDYQKVAKYGNIIEFGSLKHWIYYLIADRDITTQKYANPAPAVFHVLHKIGLFNNRIFLQHGIVMSYIDYLQYKNTHFKVFVCGAKKEYDYVIKTYGYPKGTVKNIGLARFDNLFNHQVNNKQILIMPGWRMYISKDRKSDFLNSKYYQAYMSLINNQLLIDKIEKENITIYFYTHRNMQKFLDTFTSKSKNIKIISKNDQEIQKLLMESALLISDYSSVTIDFAYMEKPLLYYQFDYEEFRLKHHQEGYFSFKNDGFGPVIENESTLVNKIIDYIDNGFKLELLYKRRSDEFFGSKDDQNCKRTFDIIDKL